MVASPNIEVREGALIIGDPDEAFLQKGGPGSGHHGHGGRPGKRGGSSSGRAGSYNAHFQGLEDRFGVSAKFRVVPDIPEAMVGTRLEGYVGKTTKGLYIPEDDEIVLSEAYMGGAGDSGIEMSGDVRNTAEAGWELLATHEYAHVVDVRGGDISLNSPEWSSIVKKYQRSHDMTWDMEGYENHESVISKYSLSMGISGYVESFAEAFATYVHRPGWLGRTNPDMFAFMENLEGTSVKSSVTRSLGIAEVYDGEELRWVGDVTEKGGSGSGHHGHAGRIGTVGGAASVLRPSKPIAVGKAMGQLKMRRLSRLHAYMKLGMPYVTDPKTGRRKVRWPEARVWYDEYKKAGKGRKGVEAANKVVKDLGVPETLKSVLPKVPHPYAFCSELTFEPKESEADDVGGADA